MLLSQEYETHFVHDQSEWYTIPQSLTSTLYLMQSIGIEKCIDHLSNK